jgi:Protein of unknown function (DUF664)
VADRPKLKEILHNALRAERSANLSKLEELSDYDVRRPMTPTGSNLLGVLKHLGGVEHGYLGQTFGRTLSEPIPHDDLWNNGDMWARPRGVQRLHPWLVSGGVRARRRDHRDAGSELTW